MASLLGAKLALARGVGTLSRTRGSGATSLPGKVLMRLEPGAIATLGARLSRGSALVSATNGKTTTAAMTAAILERHGLRLVHNRAGANMAGGVATTLLGAARPRGSIDGDAGLFEVDELWLARVAMELRPRAILLGNLFRDQLDRFGELEAIADSWREMLLASDATAVLNADDPLLADLGRDRPGVVYFGVEDDSLALPGLAHAADAKHCRNCGAPYVFDAVYLGHLGRYHCPSCGRARPRPEVAAREVVLNGVHSAEFTLVAPEGSVRVQLGLPGLYNVYNALGAATLARALGAPLDQIAAGLEATRPAFGRAETVELSTPAGPRTMRIMLVKNPAGANEVLRTLALEDGRHELLGVLNDRIADGRDVSWIWDADFELLAGRIARAVCSGTRAADLAARLKYAGVDRGGDRDRPRAGGGARGRGRRRRRAALRAADVHRDARPSRAARRARGGAQPVGVTAPPARLVWHDLECGGYRADLPLWRRLAGGSARRGAQGAGVLDLGAGSGRVTLDLARAGHRVSALDRDSVLLAALLERAGDLPVEAFEGDARDFALDRRDFDLCIVPMQTVQLLRGSDQRLALIDSAREHLRPGGLLACAIVADVEEFDSRDGAIGPAPDRVKLGDTLYMSRPIRVRRVGGRLRIERERLVIGDGDAEPTAPELDVVELELVEPERLRGELREGGMKPLPTRRIAETAEHSGSEVVIASA